MRMDAKPPSHPDAPWFNVMAAKECVGWNGWDRLATIYCITEGTGMPVKVGMASNLKARFSNIQCATWRPVFLCWTAVGYRPHEAALKKAMRQNRIAGEWYSDADDKLKCLLKVGDSEANLILAIEALATENNMAIPHPKPSKPVPSRGRPMRPFKGAT
jgi:hypothetical protein